MKTLRQIGFAVFVLGMVYAFAMTTGNQVFAVGAMLAVGVASALTYKNKDYAFETIAFEIPKDDDPIWQFKKLPHADIVKMEPDAALDYAEKRSKFENATLAKQLKAETERLMTEKSAGYEAEILKLKKDIADVVKTNDDFVLQLRAEREPANKNKVDKGLIEFLKENSTVLKAIKENKTNKHKGFSFDLVTKGTQGASDIGSRDYLGEIEPGIGKIPVRNTTILSLFGRKTVGTEYLHYWEENVVTRDAKFVIACATSTHTTKKTWIKRTVELAKLRDMVDVCIDMLEDYDFVESEIRQLVDESIMLKADYELLLGASAAATDMLSIDYISSEFNPSNVLADYSSSFTHPTIGDLTAAMKGQIYTFGQERAWQANTVLMNYTDMIKYFHAKDTNGVYLFPNFVSGATNEINGMRIVTSPIVVQNTLYVFDSTKGKILDRKRLTVVASYENNDNVEHELVTFVAHERLQFHVRLIDQDAFMKCSDIATAISVITNTAS